MKDPTNKIETVLFIVGKPRHGKDTLAEAVSNQTGLQRGACSDIIFDSIANSLVCDYVTDLNTARKPEASDERLQSLIPRISEALRGADKEALRPILIARGDALGSLQADFMVQRLLEKGVRVITGIRRRHEFEAVKRNLKVSNYRPVFVWVERDGFDGPKDNLELTAEDCDMVFSFKDGELPYCHPNLISEFYPALL